MAELKVETYCVNCPYFKPDYKSENIRKAFLPWCPSEITEVRCEHWFICQRMANMMKGDQK